MWNSTQTGTGVTSTRCLSHDRPCSSCGHAMHSYLPCSDTCSCTPQPAPGLAAPQSSLATV